MPNALDLTIYADQVIIEGPILIPARNVTINARTLDTRADSSKNAASISVVGVTGTDPPEPPLAPPQAQPGLDAHDIAQYPNPITPVPATEGATGTPGNTGQQGNPGGPGGSIALLVESFGPSTTLTLSTDGGLGGVGQIGQAGGQGGHGGNCFPRQGYESQIDPADGGQGGTAGQGGKGGTGGPAGTISLSYVNVPATLPSMSCSAGAGGPGGKAGPVGQGGPPGQPAPGTGTASQGLPGAAALAGGKGDSGGAASTPKVTKVGYNALASGGNAAQRLMMLQRAKLTYLTADPSDAQGAAYRTTAILLDFLIKVTTSPLPAFSPNDVTTLENINTEATILLSRLSRALDFYGNPPNWVPMVSYETYGPIVGELVAELSETETAVNNYFSEYASVANATTALTATVNHANASLASLQKQLGAAEADASLALQTVENDDGAVNNEHDVLTFRIKSLETKLELIAQKQFGQKCLVDSLIKGLNFVTTVSGATEFKNAGTILKGIQGLVPAASGDGGAALEAQIKKLDVLGSTVETLPEAAQTAYQSQSGPIITTQDPNAYKLLQAQSAFDTLVEKFTGLTGAAQEAIDAMNRYVSLVLQRNADVLSYNAKINQLNALHAQIAQTTALIAQANTQLQAANPDPQLPAMVAFVSRLYEDGKWRIIWQFYLAFRALSHWSLNTSYASFYSNGIFDLSSLDQINAGTLNSFESVMQNDWAQALEAFAAPPQTFPASGPGIEIVIDNVDVIAALRKNYQVRFSIPHVLSSMTLSQTPFAHRCNVRITKVRPWLVGAKSISGTSLIEVTIDHLGREAIVDQLDNVFIFTHQPTSVIFSYPQTSNPANPVNIQQEPNFGYVDPNDKQELQYALLSPFTTYHLQVDRTAVDLSNVTSITMEFFGTNGTFAGTDP